MNSFIMWAAVSASLALTIIIYAAAMRLAKHKIATRFAGGASALLVMALCVAFSEYCKYKSYGAFYDNSWKEPGIESHFLFKNDDTEALQGIYDSDPAGFRYDLYDVLLVKLGCEDCEKAEKRLLAAKAEIESKKGRPAYIIFSRSAIGETYVARYGIESVPCVIVDGSVLDVPADD